MTQDYARDQTIDTSPSAHIFVMAQQNSNGILLSHYAHANSDIKTGLGADHSISKYHMTLSLPNPDQLHELTGMGLIGFSKPIVLTGLIK